MRKVKVENTKPIPTRKDGGYITVQIVDDSILVLNIYNNKILKARHGRFYGGDLMKLINKKVLILPIKKKWFDMIRYGEKLEEYRDIKPYYEVRFQNHFGLILIENQKSGITKLLQGEDVPEEIRKEPVQEIIFRNGYGKNAPQILAKCSIRIGHGRTDWGAEEGKQYFILEIIEKISYGALQQQETVELIRKGKLK